MWEWEYVVVDATLGALGGALGWLATRRLRQHRKSAADLIAVAVAVFTLTVGGQLAAPKVKDFKLRRAARAAGLELYGNARSAALHAEVFLPLLRNPRLLQRLAPAQVGGSTQTGFAELVHAGMARLNSGELEAIFDVRRAMAAKSNDLCAGLWTGNIPPDSLFKSLKDLSEAQQRTWITVSGRAASLELEANTRPLRMAGATRDQAMADLTQSLAPEALSAFTKASEGGSPTPPEACLAFRALADGIKTMPPAVRETIIRMINNPELVDR